MEKLELNNHSPVLIGGVGGSGTRAVCNILIKMGFFMGDNLNPAFDEKTFKPFFKNYIRMFLEEHSLAKKNIMKKVFLDCLFNYLKTKPRTEKWGFKKPRSILLLPFLHEIFPKMKFIQVIRDRRDMALSKNQMQVRLFGDLFCKNSIPNTLLYSLEFWSRVNLKSYDYGISKLKNNYLVIRYEDLINEPTKTVKRIADFTNIVFHDFSSFETIIHDPKTIGRWKGRKNEFLDMPKIAKDVLDKFRYMV